MFRPRVADDVSEILHRANQVLLEEHRSRQKSGRGLSLLIRVLGQELAHAAVFGRISASDLRGLFGVRGRTDMAGPVGNEASSAVLVQFGHMRTDLRTWSLSPGGTSWIEANAATSPRNHGEWRVENNPERIRHAPRPPDPPRTGRVPFRGIAGEPTWFAPVSDSPTRDAIPRREVLVARSNASADLRTSH